MKKIFSVLVAFIAMTTVSAQTENKVEITAECGDNVEITATAKTGWHFAGWEDGVAANPRLVENVNMDSTFYAMWERNDYTVTIIIDTDKGPGAGGTTTINGVESTTGNFKFEAECNLAVVVDNCYEFKGWTDGVDFYEPGSTYKMTKEPLKLTAVWENHGYAPTALLVSLLLITVIAIAVMCTRRYR